MPVSAVMAPANNRTMRVSRIDHVQLAMPPGAEDEAVAFYEGVLRVPRVPKPAHLAGRGGCWFESDSVKIHLGVEADFRPARKAHPALLVDDLPSLVEQLHASGFTTTGDEPFEGYHRVYTDDPFGNRVELLEPLGGEHDIVGPALTAPHPT